MARGARPAAWSRFGQSARAGRHGRSGRRDAGTSGYRGAAEGGRARSVVAARRGGGPFRAGIRHPFRVDRAVAQYRVRARPGADRRHRRGQPAHGRLPAGGGRPCRRSRRGARSDGVELAYCRQRFIVECRAANVVAVDCPYTWSDAAGVERDTRWARRLGYVAKSLVDPTHAAAINSLLTPGDDDLRRAQAIVMSFEAARARGGGRAELDGSLIEVPTYSNARRFYRPRRSVAAIR